MSMNMPDQDVADPKHDFGETTPYGEYVKTPALYRLQQPVSTDPAEMSFLVTTQVMELWFVLLVHEWRTARQALEEDRLPDALTALRRSVAELDAMNASWEPISSLTPAQFNSYRGALGEASGFQSAAYRQLEFLLGEKNASLLQPHRGAPEQYAELERALHEPSLYDAVLAFLHRGGLAVPASVLERDPTKRYEPDPDVEAVWTEIYAGKQRGELVELGEVLTDVAQRVGQWRSTHLVATRRAMGAKPGTAGSSGVAWLEKRADKLVFPEVWTARSYV